MTVWAITTDLMDGSKIRSAVEGVRVVRSAADLVDVDVDVDVVLVDLALPGALEAALGAATRVLAYGSHVDDETLAAADSAGAEAMPRSVFFRRLREGTLLDTET